jgi:hypothetical protein
MGFALLTAGFTLRIRGLLLKYVEAAWLSLGISPAVDKLDEE